MSNRTLPTVVMRLAAALLAALLASACTEPASTDGSGPSSPTTDPANPAGAAIPRADANITSESGAAQSGEATADRPRPAGEQLLADAPQGWRQTLSLDKPGLRMAEYVPGGETLAEWSEKISIESLAGKPLPDPIEFVNGLSDDQQGTCEGFEAFSTFSGEENGYPTAVHLLVCHRNKLLDVSQVTMIKAIQGEQNFYVVTRSKRGPALTEAGDGPISEVEVAGWTLYLRAISVCDPTRAEHPCP